MLVEFTVGNHLSFKDNKTLSLEAAPIKEFEKNVFKIGNYNLLKSAVIYGANSSGKSNLIKGLTTMQQIVIESAKKTSTEKIDVTPFLLNLDSEKKPSYFEVLIMIGGYRYRYGFEVDENIVHTEWLFRCKSKKELPLFYREKNKIEITKDFVEGKGLEERTRENALFLSVVDQFNGEISKEIMGWFGKQQILSGIKHEKGRFLTLAFFEQDSLKQQVHDFLNHFNLGFKDFEIISDHMSTSKVKTLHNKYNAEKEVIGSHSFDLNLQESSGTNKLFDFAGDILFGLLTGTVTIIDELDAKLHPLLTMAIVKLFNSESRNERNAQLIFATHDTNLLNYGEFRRDQIYFTEKNEYEETDLYSLVEYKDKIRNDRNYEKDYIQGRYGAIPFIGNSLNIIGNGSKSEN